MNSYVIKGARDVQCIGGHAMENKTLREVCGVVGVTRRTVQGYEKAGLVAPAGKNKYGYLLYDEIAIEKIKVIKKHQDFGFQVKQIKILLEVTDKVYVEMLVERLKHMRCELQKMQTNIKEIEELILEKQ